jgi:hypothetical protein
MAQRSAERVEGGIQSQRGEEEVIHGCRADDRPNVREQTLDGVIGTEGKCARNGKVGTGIGGREVEGGAIKRGPDRDD